MTGRACIAEATAARSSWRRLAARVGTCRDKGVTLTGVDHRWRCIRSRVINPAIRFAGRCDLGNPRVLQRAARMEDSLARQGGRVNTARTFMRRTRSRKVDPAIWFGGRCSLGCLAEVLRAVIDIDE